MDNRWRPSVTVAAVIERDGRFLLIEEETSGGMRLNNPAGHLERGESLAEACAREALEEAAWTFHPTALVGIYMARFIKKADGEDITYLRFAFCGELGEHHPERPLDEGIARTLWLTIDEIRARRAELRSPMVLRCIEDYLAGMRIPLAALHADPSVYAPS